jgi:hypothetical protein
VAPAGDAIGSIVIARSLLLAAGACALDTGSNATIAISALQSDFTGGKYTRGGQVG